jgi:REP element-mobilizing transposase RayT
MPRPRDPNRPQRRSTRLPTWDYAAPGAHFVTICTHERANLFDRPDFRELVENAWRNIPGHPHARHVSLDEWVVMPNHLHGILIIHAVETASVIHHRGSALSTALSGDGARTQLLPGSIGAIVGNFKALVARRLNQMRRTPSGKVWQRGYFDRIVRNARELNAIRQYIRDNPARWDEDRENLDGLLARMRHNP